ncbi:Acyl-CoA dehydrogenase [Oryzisolibacter propanilivorax]|uniref:Acyl-CoA dehydrogenase n=1 Tax=Oryzisolibacter propanilivorax TaxID=1527607 RepID=A0A1G9NVV3_9BURK|nr:acyl-CoA dehydrogenase family protein [Oryzisolibacter propanilivorax]SDL90519.1 Acyl-CoA dehydrogenase [Oryzisolibacter propanilivorax]
MDFTFSEDQIAFRDSISRFLMTEAAPEHLRDIWETQSGHAPELWARLAEQGLLGLSVPEAEGGMGMNDIDWALLLQETGYYALPDCVTDTAYVAVGMLAALPPEHPVRVRWLPRIAAGKCCVAVGHPLNLHVLGAATADLLLLPHRTEAGLELHAVLPADCRITPLRSLDSSRRLCQVQWTPGAATLILDGASGAAVWRQAGLRGALAASAQLVGLAQRMLDLSVDYAAQRKQFDRAIGSFQAVQHHLADIVTRVEFAKPVLYRAFYALQHGEPEAALRVSHAKLQCGEAGWFAARNGLQVHGAMGYTWEVDLQMFMKRAWALDAAWGDRAHHSGNLATGLLEGEHPPIGPGHTFDRQDVGAAGQAVPVRQAVPEEVAA